MGQICCIVCTVYSVPALKQGEQVALYMLTTMNVLFKLGLERLLLFHYLFSSS